MLREPKCPVHSHLLLLSSCSMRRNGQKVGVLLEELGLPYDTHVIDIRKGMHAVRGTLHSSKFATSAVLNFSTVQQCMCIGASWQPTGHQTPYTAAKRSCQSKTLYLGYFCTQYEQCPQLWAAAKLPHQQCALVPAGQCTGDSSMPISANSPHVALHCGWQPSHAGDQFSEEFKKVNPNSKIPGIVDPDGPGK